MTTQNGYSPPGVPGSGELAALPGRRSSSPVSDQPVIGRKGAQRRPSCPSLRVNTVIESL